MIDFGAVLGALVRGNVEFIIVGGAAATIHGSARLTSDLDIVYRRSAENIRRLALALAEHRPYLRGAPAGLPFRFDEDTLKRGLNFTLTTSFGDLDLLGEVAGGGGFEALRPHCAAIRMFGLDCLCPDLDTLIALKRAAGRPRDLEAIAELESLRDEKGR